MKRKNLLLILVAALVLSAFFVACKADIEAPSGELVDVTFAMDGSRALSATLEDFDPDLYYWKYAAAKNAADTSGLNSGATEGYKSGSEAREAGALWIHEGVSGLSGTVPGFSQGLWDFTLYAYTNEGTSESPVYSLTYLGEAEAVSLVKSGLNKVHVVVSPAPEGNGKLYIGETTLNPKKTGDIPSVSRFLKVEDFDGNEYAPTSGTTYILPAETYRVTVTYKASGITYADGMVIATVYPNMTTTVTGSVDELVTYAQFEAERNPDIIFRTAEADGIKVNQLVETGSYTLEDTAKSETVAAVVTATVPKEAAWALIAAETTDPSATMSLALNVDTVDSTSTSVTYEIGMTKTITVDGSMPETSDVTALNDYVIATVELSAGLTGVKVTHDQKDMTSGEQWAEAAGKDLTPENFIKYAGTEEDPDLDGYYYYYEYQEENVDKATLYIKTKTFSPFQVTYDGQTAGVAELNGKKYATLVAACEALPQDGGTSTITLLCDAEGAGLFLPANLDMNIVLDLAGHTYTCTGPAVGSTGTENQALHLEKDNTVTVKNGTITSTPGSGVKMLVQNYSNLTLEDVILDGTNIGEGQYTLSNNCGVSYIIGSTTIIAPSKGKAFDVCSGWGGYTSCVVNLNTTGTIDGDIEVSDWKNNTDGVYLNVDAAVLTGDIVVPEWTDKIHISKVCYNANTNVWYHDLQAAVTAATSGDTIVMVQNVSLNSVLLIDRDITIQGKGLEIKNSASRIVRITSPKCNVKIYDWKMTSVCQDSSDVRGISFDNASSGSKLLLDGCSVSASFYVINAIPGANNLEVTIKNGTIAAGWAAINSYSNNSTWTIENSTLKGLNDKSESTWNNFNTITFDGNALYSTSVGAAGTGNTVSISNTTIYASSESENIQHWIGIQYGAQGNTVVVSGDSKLINEQGADMSSNMKMGYYYNYVNENWSYYVPTSTITIGENTHRFSASFDSFEDLTDWLESSEDVHGVDGCYLIDEKYYALFY